MTREKDEGRRSAEKTLLESLGVQSPEQIKAIKEAADRQLAADKAAMTEAERAKAEATEALQRAQATEALATSRMRDATVKSLLVGASARADRVDDAALLIANGLAADADEATTKAAVESFKTTHAEWFGTPAAPPAPSGLPGGSPPPPTGDKSGLAQGREAAKKIFNLPEKQPA